MLEASDMEEEMAAGMTNGHVSWQGVCILDS